MSDLVLIVTEFYTVVAVFACVLFYGAALAYWQRQYPLSAVYSRGSDMAVSIMVATVCGVLWPVGIFLMAVITQGFRHGFMWRTANV